jgi:hypothetical protein
LPLHPLHGDAVQLRVGRGQDEGQRHLEDLGHLERVGRGFQGRRQQADEGLDLEAGAADIGVEPADDLDLVPRQADLLLGLAQRRRQRIGIAGIDAAAGKGDLAGMRGQVRRAQGQQDGVAVRPPDDRHQHRRRAQARQRLQVRVQVVVAAGEYRPVAPQPLQIGHDRGRLGAHAWSSGKKVRWLQTPIRPSWVTAISASS